MNASASTIVDRLIERAQLEPDRTAFWFLQDKVRELSERMTYGELHLKAHALSSEIADATTPGSRVAVLYPQSGDLLLALFGCFYARVIPIFLYPPHARRRDERLLGILSNAEVSLILAPAKTAEQLAANPHYANLLPKVLIPEITTPALMSANLTLPRGRPHVEEVAFLQYTSGSTRMPRGVAVSHSNLVANIAMIAGSLGWNRDTIQVSWLPMFHDMGLIGDTLTPIQVGFPCAKIAPAQFIRKPLLWLEAVTQFKATSIGSPNFGYELCAERITDEELGTINLSSLTTAYCGAEPVREATLRRFSERFQRCGFRPTAWLPCYGLAEATLIVSGSLVNGFPRSSQTTAATECSEASHGVSVVSCGHPCKGGLVKIVHPESRVTLGENQVGEVWVGGPHVPRGYWNSADENEMTFCQTTAEGDGGFLRTGDLGFIDGGELFICGRIKDIIITHGSKHHPEDIEQTARDSHPDLRLARCAAFAAEGDYGERAVLLVESGSFEKALLEQIAQSVGRAVFVRHGLPLSDCRFVPRGTLPVTTSGKIQRRLCRALYTSLPQNDESRKSSTTVGVVQN